MKIRNCENSRSLYRYRTKRIHQQWLREHPELLAGPFLRHYYSHYPMCKQVDDVNEAIAHPHSLIPTQFIASLLISCAAATTPRRGPPRRASSTYAFQPCDCHSSLLTSSQLDTSSRDIIHAVQSSLPKRRNTGYVACLHISIQQICISKELKYMTREEWRDWSWWRIWSMYWFLVTATPASSSSV